jgi:hypothetical protein
MATSYGALCDDFYVNANLTTELDMPSSRETLLHFFERFQRAYPGMHHFQRREDGDLVLEEDKDSGAYRWVAVEQRRLAGGAVNPESLAAAYEQHRLMLELAPSYLTVTKLDAEHLDVLFGFDFTCAGNHDEIIAEALFSGSALACLSEEPRAKPVEFEPLVVFALDEGCRLQARLSIETRTTTYQVRTGEYRGDEISVYFTVRQYWGPEIKDNFEAVFRRQCAVCEDLVNRKIVPRILQPISQAISTRG